MQKIHLGLVASGCLALSSWLSACGDDQPGPLRRDSGGGSSGESGGRGARGGSSGSDAGGEAGAAPEGGTGQGGRPTGGSGGNGNRGGTSGAATGGTGNEGGEAGSGGESDQLSICSRLVQVGQLTFDVTLAYESALIADCRVNWVTSLYFDSSIGLNERDVFLNNLILWNLQLWGCNATAPASFALIHRPAPLTSADARALIDDYVEVATDRLSMSPPEIAEMRALLTRLSEPVVEEVSDEYSNPDCAGGAGGV